MLGKITAISAKRAYDLRVSTTPAVSADPLRELNRQRVLEQLSRSGALTQSELGRTTGLSRTTISSILTELRDGGLVEDVRAEDPGRRGRGRPATLVTLAPPPGYAAAVDFGQRHVRVAVAALAPRVLAERVEPFDTPRSGRDALDEAAALLARVIPEAGLEREQLSRVVLGVPGPLDPATGNLLSGVILPGWTRIDPAVELQRRIGIPVTAENDANLGALGEAAFGAAKGLGDVVYVKVATGIGAGLVLGGRLHRGTSGIAGEIGHVQVRTDGLPCRCGSTGCLEAVVRVPQLLADLTPPGGPALTLPRLLERVRAGEPTAVAAMRSAGREIGRVVAPLCNALNPAAVVMGGLLGPVGQPLLDGVRESIDEHAQQGAAEAVTVLAGTLGDRAEVLGALALAAQEAGHRIGPSALAAP
ncbi:putative NBD/HSP70 family sugar kinase [Motilibacter rhizosphaerae]|uniref:Putative NBD/HSP70 family sugar kinase n=2 Tax=Motilibacter rhizosphaerae TaxID=598652 RepID=A0A4Q7NPN9_9ACTN|nr:putative NBD/HSP70 family sugar kinase [Motilibacter rhizosphaerae]